MDDLARRALDCIDVDEAVRLTQALVRIPSITGTADELLGQDWIAEQWLATGIETDVWDDEPFVLAAADGFPGVETAREVVRGAAGRLRGTGSGRSLLLGGHVDVVPPGDLDLWSGDPFDGRVAGEAIWGAARAT